MLHLIWALLNIGLLIYLLTLCYKVTKLIREKKGLLVAVIFIAFLISLFGMANENYFGELKNETNKWENKSADSLNLISTYLDQVEIGNNLVSSYKLQFIYGKDQNQHIVAHSAYPTNTGLIAGAIWTPISTFITSTENEKQYNYVVSGVIEWNLLGISICTEQKNFSGSFSVVEK